MRQPFRPSHGWGPAGHRAALSITFDNLGEAAELELGWWKDKPIGEHHTARFVPELLTALGDVRATYFVEASNTALYPDALRLWHGAGHEIGIHGWRHEFWARCEPARRRDILARSTAAFAAMGIEVSGFRPPGGAMPPEAWQEFEDAGLRYCSPLDPPGAGRVAGMVSLPFRWTDVDGFIIDPDLGFLRVELGLPKTAFPLAYWRDAVLASFYEAVAESSHRVVIFHPHSLSGDPARLDVVRDLIEAARSADVWIAPMGDVARFVDAEATRT